MPGSFIFMDLGDPNAEYLQITAVDAANQTFTAVFGKSHALGEPVQQMLWPTPVLKEGEDLAFDILAVASPDLGSVLTVVIQT